MTNDQHVGEPARASSCWTCYTHSCRIIKLINIHMTCINRGLCLKHIPRACRVLNHCTSISGNTHELSGRAQVGTALFWGFVDLDGSFKETYMKRVWGWAKIKPKTNSARVPGGAVVDGRDLLEWLVPGHRDVQPCSKSSLWYCMYCRCGLEHVNTYISLSLYIYIYIYMDTVVLWSLSSSILLVCSSLLLCVYIYNYVHLSLSLYLCISLSLSIYIYIYMYICIYVIVCLCYCLDVRPRRL